MGTALQLLNTTGDPRGKRYSLEEREAAYRSWASTDRRSFAETARKRGIAENTVRGWAAADRWAERAQGEADELAEMGKVAVFAQVVGELDRSLSTLIELRDHADNPRVRLDAALSLLAIAGVSTKSATVTTKPAAPVPGVSDTKPLTAEERKAIADRLAARTGPPVPTC